MSKEYKIYVLNSENRINLAYDLIGNSDADAMREAELFAEANSVELWQGSRMVSYITRKAS
jgi:hypothetical protein